MCLVAGAEALWRIVYGVNFMYNQIVFQKVNLIESFQN